MSLRAALRDRNGGASLSSSKSGWDIRCHLHSIWHIYDNFVFRLSHVAQIDIWKRSRASFLIEDSIRNGKANGDLTFWIDHSFIVNLVTGKLLCFLDLCTTSGIWATKWSHLLSHVNIIWMHKFVTILYLGWLIIWRHHALKIVRCIRFHQILPHRYNLFLFL